MSNGSNDLSEHVSVKPKWGKSEAAFGGNGTSWVCCLYVGMYHFQLHSAI